MSEKKSRVQSVSKAFIVLEALADSSKSELGISELTSILQWNRTTVYRFLQTLVDEGYVMLVSEGERYRLTFKLVELANKIVDNLDIRKISHPYMAELVEKWHLNTHLALLDGHEIVFLEAIDYDKFLGTKFHIGRKAPVHATGIGKAIMSTWDNQTVERYLLNYEFQKYTPNTLTNKGSFEMDLFKLTQNGYGIDRGEFNYDTCCIAAPIKDINGEATAGISISGSENQLNSYPLKELGESIKESARKISIQLGYFEKK